MTWNDDIYMNVSTGPGSAKRTAIFCHRRGPVGLGIHVAILLACCLVAVTLFVSSFYLCDDNSKYDSRRLAQRLYIVTADDVQLRRRFLSPHVSGAQWSARHTVLLACLVWLLFSSKKTSYICLSLSSYHSVAKRLSRFHSISSCSESNAARPLLQIRD